MAPCEKVIIRINVTTTLKIALKEHKGQHQNWKE